MPPEPDLTAELLDAKRAAWALAYAARIPGATPDFTGCGGPAAEAYWDYFTPARLLACLTALGAVLDLADRYDLGPEHGTVNCRAVAEQFRSIIRDEMGRLTS
jgi:hypothetical protein